VCVCVCVCVCARARANVSVQFIALWLQVMLFFTLLIRTNKLSNDGSFIGITDRNHTSCSEIQLIF